MYPLGMLLTRPPSLKEQNRQLIADNLAMKNMLAGYKKLESDWAEKQVYLILRLEALREKFHLDVDAVNIIAEQFLAVQSERKDMKERAARNVRELTINGQQYPVASSTPADPASPTSPAPSAESPAHCASDDASTESRVVDFPAQAGTPAAQAPAAEESEAKTDTPDKSPDVV